VTTCAYPPCTGTVDETGFCDVCGRQPPEPAPDPADLPGTEVAPAPLGSGATGGSVHSDVWTIARLVTMRVFTFEDPSSRIIADPESLELTGVCGKDGCQTRLGVSYAGQPALSRGYCPRCGTPYSFLPRLRPGDVVADQYEVVGPLARGGLGWVYLAKDTHLDGNFVALKGIINTNDRVALSLAVSERRFLTSLDHPNIVRIFNFVQHADDPLGEQTGYIVMEYLNGRSLREFQRDALQSGRLGEALPLEHVIGYGHEILAALAYLHGRGLLYCDMKPDNVIRAENRVKLIDLGGVRSVDDDTGPIVGTPRYQVSREEIQKWGLTVRSDIYTVGKTLEALFHASADHLNRHRADPDERSVKPAIESFERLIKRATADEKHRYRRFASADEMSEQLTGVLREVLALRLGKEHPEPSTVFAPTASLLDAGLGAVPPLDRWTVAGQGVVLADGRPTPLSVATGLPVPRIDPEDPNADLLATISAPDPRGMIDQTSAIRPDSVEVQLIRCRAYVELSDVDAATACVDRAASTLGVLAPYDWRISWHRALLALAAGDVVVAEREFDAVYDAVPGEVAPKLALGACAEQMDRPDQAERYYHAVWQRDRSQVSAAFGLARIRLSRGERDAAIAVLDEVPRVSRHYDAARIASVRICSGRLAVPSTGTAAPARPAAGLPTAANLREAVRRLSKLDLDGGDPDGESRHRLTAAVRETALHWLVSGPDDRLDDGGTVLGSPATEPGVRRLLESSFRVLARQARSADEHGTLVDLANAARPKTLL
jgi:serine/threonine-protein kinase PknG